MCLLSGPLLTLGVTGAAGGSGFLFGGDGEVGGISSK